MLYIASGNNEIEAEDALHKPTMVRFLCGEDRNTKESRRLLNASHKTRPKQYQLQRTVLIKAGTQRFIPPVNICSELTLIYHVRNSDLVAKENMQFSSVKCLLKSS